MVFELADNDQAMDVLKYITKKDYECNIGVSILYAKAEIDAKNELNDLIENSCYVVDDAIEKYLEYTGNKRKEIDNYILQNTIESIADYNEDDYIVAIQEDLLYYMREYFEKYKDK